MVHSLELVTQPHADCQLRSAACRTCVADANRQEQCRSSQQLITHVKCSAGRVSICRMSASVCCCAACCLPSATCTCYLASEVCACCLASATFTCCPASDARTHACRHARTHTLSSIRHMYTLSSIRHMYTLCTIKNMYELSNT